MLPSKICYFWCICVSILFTGRSEKQGCALRKISRGLEAGGGGLLWLIFAGFVLLTSQNPFPILVYSGAKYRPHLGHFWENVIFVITT